ncbi:hypothetical protein Tco_1561941 [Tanacetum coccineum]
MRVTAALPPPPLPPLPPSLPIPSPVDRRDDIPESEQPPRKRLHLSTIRSRYEIGESSTARPVRGQGIDYGFISTVDAEERRQGIRDVGYGIRDTWVDPAEVVPEIAPMTVGEVNTRVVELAELHERDTQDLYALLEDAQDGRSRISQRVDMNSQRVDLLMGDRMTLQETVWRGEEAYAPRAWARSDMIEPGDSSESFRPIVIMCMHITLSYRHTRHSTAASTLIQTQHQDMRREMSDMQAELLALREHQSTVTAGPRLGFPDHQEGTGDADSHFVLTLICTKFVANETEKVDKYLSGLPDNIYGNVKAAKPKTLDETIELANDLMDRKLLTYAERQSDNKRKADDSSRNNHGHQHNPSKGQNVARALQHGDRRKEAIWGIFAQVQQVPSSP